LAFLQTHNGWREIAESRLFYFDEGSSSAGFTELIRANPPATVRLYADRCEVASGGKDFRPYYMGRWSDEPYPFHFAVRVSGTGQIVLPPFAELLRYGSAFTVELWFRPIAEMPPGRYSLVSNGTTSLNWELQEDGKHRFVVRTKGKRFYYFESSRVVPDWYAVVLAQHGPPVLLSNKRVGSAPPAATYLGDAPGSGPLTIGGDSADNHGFWADVGGFRLSKICRLGVDKPDNFASQRVQAPVPLPGDCQPDASTLILLDMSRPVPDAVPDRSGRGELVKLAGVRWVDVLRSPAYVDRKTAGSAVAAAPGSPTRSLADLVRPSPAPPAITEPVKRRLVPSGDEQSKTLERVREIFQSQYSEARKAAAKVALAKQLAGRARATTDDSVARYVMWDQAIQLATEGGQSLDAFRWIDELGREFEFDVLVRKLAAGTRIHELLFNSSTAPLKLRTQLIEQTNIASNTALALERFDEAERFAQISLYQSRSRHVTDEDIKRDAKDHAELVTRIRRDWVGAQEAEKKIASGAANDPDYYAAGRFRCFLRNEWSKGLPHLVKSGQPDLAKAAQLDLASGSDANAQLAAAQSWEKAAEAVAATERIPCLERARFHFAAALKSGLKGLDRELALQRINAIHRFIPPSHPAVQVKMPDGNMADVHPGMIGRVLVGGRDTGVLVTYQLDKPLSADVLKGIVLSSQYQGPVRIELGGVLLTTPDQDAIVMLLDGGGNGAQQASIDDQQAARVESDQRSDHQSKQPSIGLHQIVWHLAGVDETVLNRLSVVDFRSRQPATVFYTKQMLDRLRPSPLKKGEFRAEFSLSGRSAQP
jgi:hypothetical protein